MKLAALFLLIMLVVPGFAALNEAPAARNLPGSVAAHHALGGTSRAVAENNFDLSAFGAVGDGVADDGPALQSALDAIAEAGGGTLFVPAGRYAITTPVQKDFAGLASSVIIQGVESSTPVAPPTAGGHDLTRGLDLVSEFAPRTGPTQNAITISGLKSFLIKDIVFIGTPGVANDALITLALLEIEEATVRHCEFYGLASVVEGGSIILAVKSHLIFEQSVVLGSACSSGVYGSIIQNLQWKGVTVSEAIFADYGQRAELYGKMDNPPFSWISLGNAAVPDNDSPRREAVVRSVFFDEGGYVGISSLTYRYSPPASAPIDLLYITDVFMNVSNLGTTGNLLYGLQGVLIAKSHYGWSHNTNSAIDLSSVDNAIIDEVECVASADRIRADAATGNLTVINSVYAHLDSQAQATKVITTATPEADPVQYVRQQFMATLGRAPDAAAHYYWSNQILQCGDDGVCVSGKQAALATYLGSAPSPKFAINGRLTDDSGASLSGVVVTLSGAQLVTTTTDSAGEYHFSNLPTSGVYTVTPTLRHHTLNPSSRTMVTPAGDQVFDSAATFNHHVISGRMTDTAGAALSDVAVTLSGTQDATATTDANGTYSFANLPAGGNYTVTPRKISYAFSPVTFQDLDADQNLNFTGTLVTYTISGVLVGLNNNRKAGVTVTLSGWLDRTTTSDIEGNFYFTGLPAERDYTVTPTLIEYSFSPSSRTYSNLDANHYENSVAIYTTHSISGRITDASSGTAVAGAVVTFSGHTSGTTTSDADGNYNLDLPRHGNYTLTVARAHYTFAQPAQTFTNLTSGQTANFAATLNRHNITGRTLAGDGSALSGVTVTLSGSQTSTITTDQNGAFAFANLPGGGNYTVTPSKTSYAWVPPNLIFNDLGSNQAADFTGTFVRHNVSGRVTENGSPLSGVSILLSGSETSTAVSDVNGNYSFSLPSEGSYTVTPSKQHYTFTPTTVTFNNLIANQTGNFAAIRNRHRISGRVVNINNSGLAEITVSLSGSQTATTITDSAGNYSFPSLPADGTYIVTPSVPYHSFVPANQTYTNLASDQQNSFVAGLNTHTISGRVNDDSGNPLAGATVTLSNSAGPIATSTSDAAGNYSFGSLPAGIAYIVAVSNPNYIFNPASYSFSALNSNLTANLSGTLQRVIEFSSANYTVSEGTATVTITITRTGNTSGEASVFYLASNGTGSQGKDLNSVIGRLHFANGETSQTFIIFITDDSFVENVEQLTLTLSDPHDAVLGNRVSATLIINDNDSGVANPNPIDDAQFFVRQHYRDFLNREPDADGLAFWSNQITACGSNAVCVDDRRINVSAAFFLSIEFRETGFLVQRLYQASFGRPPQYLDEFILDRRRIAEGIVVNSPGWQQLLENNKSAFVNDFVERLEFTTEYPLTMTPVEYVNALNAKAGGALSADDLTAAVAEFAGSATSSETVPRARVLRRVAESQTFSQQQLSPAFVLMQYFGYLQRNPSDPPNSNLDGYNFWLSKLNEFGGDFHRAEMVRAFLVSSEYRNRFGL